jgi:hypothetical protein
MKDPTLRQGENVVVKGVITCGNNQLVYFYLPSYCFKDY